jgi:hypothetical protein
MAENGLRTNGGLRSEKLKEENVHYRKENIWFTIAHLFKKITTYSLLLSKINRSLYQKLKSFQTHPMPLRGLYILLWNRE